MAHTGLQGIQLHLESNLCDNTHSIPRTVPSFIIYGTLFCTVLLDPVVNQIQANGTSLPLVEILASVLTLESVVMAGYLADGSQCHSVRHRSFHSTSLLRPIPI